MSAPEGSLPGWLRLLCRLAFRVHPGSVRQRHRDEMREVVLHRWRRLQGGPWARTRMVLYLLRDARATGRARTGIGPFVASIGQDVRFGLRAMRRTPAFTATAVLTLALGIGANAAIFSVVRAVLLEPLPYPDAERIQRVMPGAWNPARQVDALRDSADGFDVLVGVGQAGFTLREDAPEVLSGTVVWPGYFRLFGVQPALGRTFREEDTRPGAEPVVVLSHRLWSGTFGSDPGIVGRVLALEGEGRPSHTVIGILPPGHDPFGWPTEVLAPVRLDVGSHDYEENFRYRIFARLDTDVSRDGARARLRGLVERLSDQSPPIFSRESVDRVELASFRQERVGDVGSTLLVMLAAVGVVLLIACVNVANLYLARSAVRRTEVAVRAALGAGRGRIVRQLLTESVVMALLGGVAGVALALAGIGPLTATLPTAIPRQAEVGVDGAVLAFALAASLLAGVLFGLAPALRAGRGRGDALHGVRGTGGDRSHTRLQSLLLAGEVGLAVVLLVAAGLLTKSLWRLHQVDPGFEPTGVVTLRLAPSADRYADAEARAGYYRQVLDRVRALPGVTEAGAISTLPLSSAVMGVGISPDGDPVPEDEDSTICSYRAVTPGAFAALGARLLEGRRLQASDGLDARPVGVINRRLAEMLWPGESPLDREVAWGTGEPWFTVVGVIEDIHQGSLAERPDPEAYVSYEQQGTWLTALHLVVRHRPGAEVLAAARAAAWEVDDDVPVTQQGSLGEQVRASMAGERGWVMVFGSFAALALVLAAVGVFGVMSYLVAQRRHEVGVRVALGAGRRDVVGTILRIGLVPVAAGLAAGSGAALLGGRLLRGLLHDVAPTDPAVLAAVVVFLAVVALVANAVPALRASRVDPVQALRSE